MHCHASASNNAIAYTEAHQALPFVGPCPDGLLHILGDITRLEKVRVIFLRKK